METGFAILMRKNCGSNCFFYTKVYFIDSIFEAEVLGKTELANNSRYVRYLIVPAIRQEDGKIFVQVDPLLSKLA